MFRLLMVALATLPGCLVGKSCTLMYVTDSLALYVSPSITDVGAWEIELADNTGDTHAICTVNLPLVDGGAASCDTDGVSLDISAAGDAIEGISLVDRAPETLNVSFTLNGALVDVIEVTPDYEVDEPNGEGCGETYSATEVVGIGDEVAGF